MMCSLSATDMSSNSSVSTAIDVYRGFFRKAKKYVSLMLHRRWGGLSVRTLIINVGLLFRKAREIDILAVDIDV